MQCDVGIAVVALVASGLVHARAAPAATTPPGFSGIFRITSTDAGRSFGEAFHTCTVRLRTTLRRSAVGRARSLRVNIAFSGNAVLAPSVLKNGSIRVG